MNAVSTQRPPQSRRHDCRTVEPTISRSSSMNASTASPRSRSLASSNDRDDSPPRQERPRFRRAPQRSALSNSFTSTDSLDRRTDFPAAAASFRTAAASGRGAAGRSGGGRGRGLFRRRSVMVASNHPALELVRQQEEESPCCNVSSFHQVFNQVKEENPLLSMGAVQQMTMRRLSELQRMEREKQQESARAAAAQDRGESSDDDGRMLGAAKSAAKTLNKFVDVIRVKGAASSDSDGDERKPRRVSGPTSAYTAHLDDSFSSGASGGCRADGGAAPALMNMQFKSLRAAGRRASLSGPPGEEGGARPTLARFQSFRRKSAGNPPDDLGGRRAARASAPPTVSSAFSDPDGSSGGLLRPRTANEMYALAANEQGSNFAPRKSVGDFSAFSASGVLDASEKTGDSLASDMSGLLLEELAKNRPGEEDASVLPSVNDGKGRESEDDDDEENGVLTAFIVMTGGDERNDRRERTAARTSRSLANSTKSEANSAISGTSGVSDCTSGCESRGGLIVGFRPRNAEEGANVGFGARNASSDAALRSMETADSEDDEEEDWLEDGGFAADFTAWENNGSGR